MIYVDRLREVRRESLTSFADCLCSMLLNNAWFVFGSVLCWHTAVLICFPCRIINLRNSSWFECGDKGNVYLECLMGSVWEVVLFSPSPIWKFGFLIIYFARGIFIFRSRYEVFQSALHPFISHVAWEKLQAKAWKTWILWVERVRCRNKLPSQLF